MSKVLIVDDQDRSIQYSGSWSSENNVGDYTNEYLNSVHKSNTVGDSLEYSFVGTGISVFGTLNTPRSLGLPTPRFTIDNNDSTAFNASGEVLNWDRSRQVSHALLYKSPTLPKGNHTIKIAIASPSGTTSTTPGPFYLDFFTVDSGSDSVAGDVLLDDRDQSLLFSGSWQNAGIVEEYMGTTRQSPDANAGTMTLQFNGTAITVYGTTAQTINFGTTKISFNVDGQSTTFEGKPNLPAVLHQAVFQATSLGADKTHTLTITPLNSNPLFLDYFVYRTTNSSATTSTNTPNDHKTSNTGAIVGGVVGVVAVVLLALLGFFLWRRRRARKDNEPGHAGGTADYAGVAEPYRVPANGSQYTAVPFGSMSNIPASKNMPNNRASEVQSSFYDGDGNSTAYTGVDTHFTVSDFRSAGSDISGVNGPNANGRYVPGGTILYPQFEGVNSRPPPRSPVAPPSATYPPIPGGTYGQSEKSRFMQMDRHPPSPSRVPATAHPPESTVVSSSPPMSSFEVDSGLRIPRASPPMYTED